MKKKLLIGLLAAVMMTAPAFAAEYSDENVSFQYDDSMYHTAFLSSSDPRTFYTYETTVLRDDATTSCLVQFIGTELFEEQKGIDAGTWKEYLFSAQGNDGTVEQISDAECVIHTTNNDQYTKLILEDGTNICYATCIVSESEPEKSAAVRLMYDTITLTDAAMSNGFTPLGYALKMISEDHLISEQGNNYLMAGYGIADQYLQLATDAESAGAALDGVIERSSAFDDSSNYLGDTYVTSELYEISMALMTENDTKLVEIKENIDNHFHLDQ